jgi:hypothetical protein
MDLKLSDYTTVDYTVVTTYEDGHRAYSVATTDKSVADDYKVRLEKGLFGLSKFGRVRNIIVVERSVTTKEKVVD